MDRFRSTGYAGSACLRDRRRDNGSVSAKMALSELRQVAHEYDWNFVHAEVVPDFTSIRPELFVAGGRDSLSRHSCDGKRRH